ncbi:MAG: hypothetical protein Q9183_006877 [Haloplaca sp. 2 TL-2023]
MERRRPEKELEAQSAEDVHGWTSTLPMEGDEKADSYQARLFKSGMPKDQVAAECKDAIFAGTHSFGGVLATMLWHLIQNQDVYAILRNEIANRDPNTDAQSLPYLTAVIKEGLRLAPVQGTRLPRIVPSTGWSFSDHYFPPGTVVGVSQPILFANEEVYPDVKAFRPQRWDKPTPEMQRDFVPFSLGIRQCIARNLAMAQLTMAVEKIVESDVLKGARVKREKLDVVEWFNVKIEGNKVEIVWDDDEDEK